MDSSSESSGDDAAATVARDNTRALHTMTHLKTRRVQAALAESFSETSSSSSSSDDDWDLVETLAAPAVVANPTHFVPREIARRPNRQAAMAAPANAQQQHQHQGAVNAAHGKGTRVRSISWGEVESDAETDWPSLASPPPPQSAPAPAPATTVVAHALAHVRALQAANTAALVRPTLRRKPKSARAASERAAAASGGREGGGGGGGGASTEHVHSSSPRYPASAPGQQDQPHQRQTQGRGRWISNGTAAAAAPPGRLNIGASMTDKRSSIAMPWDISNDIYAGDDPLDTWAPGPRMNANTMVAGKAGNSVTNPWTFKQRGLVLVVLLLIAGAIAGLFVVNSKNSAGAPGIADAATGEELVSSISSNGLDPTPSNAVDTVVATAESNAATTTTTTPSDGTFTKSNPYPASEDGSSTTAAAAPPSDSNTLSTTPQQLATTAATRAAVAVTTAGAPDLDVTTAASTTTTTRLGASSTSAAVATAEGLGSTTTRAAANVTANGDNGNGSAHSSTTASHQAPGKTSPTTSTTLTATTTTNGFWWECINATEYLSAEARSAQPLGFPYNVPPTSWQEPVVSLPATAANMLRTLVWIPADGTCSTKQVARSYAGYNWEGIPPHPTHPDCATSASDSRGGCTINVTDGLHAAGVYVIHTTTRSSSSTSNGTDVGKNGANEITRVATNEEAMSRLLVQATFGPTKASIAEGIGQQMNASAEVNDTDTGMAAAWIELQMAKPISYHRAYLRRRQNPRVIGETYAGSIVGTCEAGSRWQQHAFSEVDESATLVVLSQPLRGKFAFRINGVLRTETTRFLNRDWTPNTPDLAKYRLCYIEERIGGLVKLIPIDPKNGVLDCSTKNLPHQVVDVNPAIKFTVPAKESTQVYGAGEVLLGPVNSALGASSFFLKKRKPGVKCIGAKQAGKAFMGVPNIKSGNLEYFLEDPRLKMISNTVESPSDVENEGTCPAVAKTFINSGSCARRDAGTCSAVKYAAGHSIQLDVGTLRNFATSSNKFVYMVKGLRLIDSKHFVSPCIHGVRSRWLRSQGKCTKKVLQDAQTTATIVDALAKEGSRVGSNANIIDAVIGDYAETNGGICVTTKKTIGARIDYNGSCWTHSHPNERNVYDFGKWTKMHPGNPTEASNRRNPITAFALDGLIAATYPAWHHIVRWDTYLSSGFFSYVGRFGDSVDFSTLPPALQTPEMASIAKVPSTKDDVAFEACGSRAEVANVPALGHFFFSLNHLEPQGIDQKMWPRTDVNVWQNVVLTANDQLRQRVAWALSQIFVVSAAELVSSENEAWVTFYDIFVHHAFGNYFDIMKEVSASPVMGLYLTFLNNKAQSNGAFPDENYAREIMQLFSVGIELLNQDGTVQRDTQTGSVIAPYDNNDITAFARVWTGWSNRPMRGNIQALAEHMSVNYIDPMMLHSSLRDRFPKTTLDGGYLGDGFPVCADLPPRVFLLHGAQYHRTGSKSVLGEFYDNADGKQDKIRRHFEPDPATSHLYAALCGRDKKSGMCTFPADVQLAATVPCTGKIECSADKLVAVKIVDGERVVFYSYVQQPCVELALFSNGKKVGQHDANQCAASNVVGTSGTSCCQLGSNGAVPVSKGGDECMFIAEPMTYSTAEARCAKVYENGIVCPTLSFGQSSHVSGDSPDWLGACAGNQYTWQDSDCSLKVQVQQSGEVNIVDPLTEDFRDDLRIHSGNIFRVLWETPEINEKLRRPYPLFENNCNLPGAGEGSKKCEPIAARGGTCLCDFTVKTDPVFEDAKRRLPTEDEIRSALFEATVSPEDFGDGVYTKCATSACMEASGIAAYTRSQDSRPTGFDVHTIFEIVDAAEDRFGQKTNKYYFNRQTIVQVGLAAGNARYAFRNPPNFIPNIGVHPGHPGSVESWNGQYSPYGNTEIWASAANYETNALLDHLFRHDNTPPFVAVRLIQRLVTSNPSPRYVLAVSTAFRTGKYGDKTFSGEYGDMAATISAVLLDPEARATVLDIDPKHGSLREPLLKVMHMLRAAEYKAEDGKQLTMQWLEKKIGQQVFRSPSVFNYYLPEFSPVGLIADHGLVAPEAQLGTAPFILGFMNGITSLIENGLTNCDRGFGNVVGREDLSLCHRQLKQDGTPLHSVDGALSLTLESPETPEAAVKELSLLLTSGRLNSQSQNVIVNAYDDILANKLVNLTGLKTRASSSASGSAPSNVVNGLTLGWENDNQDNACHKTRNDVQPWWYVDMGQPTTVTSITVLGQSDCCAGMTLSGFDVFVDDIKCASNIMIKTGEKKTVPCEAAGRVVKVKRTSKAASVMVLCDLQIFAKNASSSGTYDSNPIAEAAALKQALKLFAVVPEYHSTNLNALKPVSVRKSPPEQKSLGRQYKAVVVVFLEGGMDSFNMLVPLSGCTKPGSNGNLRTPNDLYEEYARVRGERVALRKDNLLPIKVGSSSDKQPCDTFGIHPSLTVLKELYDAGEATFIANAGAMIEPLTKEEYIANSKRTPPSLFAHNIMQRSAYTAHAEDAYSKGVLGRMVAALMGGVKPLKSALYSLVGYSKMMEGADIQPVNIDPEEGIVRYQEYSSVAAHIRNMSLKESQSLFGEQYSASLDAALRTTEALGDELENPSLPSDSPLFLPDTLSQQLEKVSVVMRLDKTELRTERAAFMTKQPGFDTHGGLDISPNLRHLNDALGSFVQELKLQGTWNETVIVMLSDFGRTLAPNAQGTDHGWGGNYFVIGGNIKGGQILGKFPDRLDEDFNDVSLGRGRILPTTPWESIWSGISEWWGIPASKRATVLPHAANFPERTLFSRDQLFN